MSWFSKFLVSSTGSLGFSPRLSVILQMKGLCCNSLGCLTGVPITLCTKECWGLLVCCFWRKGPCWIYPWTKDRLRKIHILKPRMEVDGSDSSRFQGFGWFLRWSFRRFSFLPTFEAQPGKRKRLRQAEVRSWKFRISAGKVMLRTPWKFTPAFQAAKILVFLIQKWCFFKLGGGFKYFFFRFSGRYLGEMIQSWQTYISTGVETRNYPTTCHLPGPATGWGVRALPGQCIWSFLGSTQSSTGLLMNPMGS